MKAISIIGKYMYILALLAFCWAHFSYPYYMMKYVPLPGASIIVMSVGVMFAVTAISLLMGKFDKISLIILGVIILSIGFVSHFPRLFNADNAHEFLIRFMDFVKVWMIAGATFAMTALAKDSRLTGKSSK